MIDLKNLWDQLSKESDAQEKSGILKRSIKSKVGLSIGYDTSDNKKLLLLNIDNPDSIKNSHFPKWEGTSIEKKPLGENKFAIILKLIDEDCINIFNALINDLLERIVNTNNNHEAVTCFADTIYKWYEFFKKFGKKVLSEQKQRGIYGELYFLNTHLKPKHEAIEILNCWKGHKLKHHDFSFPNGALEVKTTIRKAHKKVVISSEKQLDNTGFPNLYLYCITLNMDSNNGESLVDLVNNLNDYFRNQPNASTLFKKYLSNAGYLTAHENYYNENKYIFKKEYLFEVNDDFPQISNPPEGIGDIKYSLMIGSCLEHQVEIGPSIKMLF